MDGQDSDDEILNDIERNLCYLYQLIVLFGPKVLRRVFLQHWKEKEGAPWQDTQDYGQQVWDREECCYIKARLHMSTRNLIKEGNSEKWDLTALKVMLLDSSIHPLEGNDRETVELLCYHRNITVSHPKSACPDEMTKLFEDGRVEGCSCAMERLIDKFAAELKQEFIRKQESYRAKTWSIPDVRKFVEDYFDEMGKYQAASLCSVPTVTDHISNFCQHMLPLSTFEPKALSPCTSDDPFREKACEISELHRSMDAMSVDSGPDSSISDSDWGSGDDSDSEKTCFAYAYISRDASQCSACMQILDAVVLKCVTAKDNESLKFIQKLKEGNDSEAGLRSLVNVLSASKFLEFPFKGDKTINPVMQILREMFDRGLETNPRKEMISMALKIMAHRIKREEDFSVLIEKAAKHGFFSVERAVSTLSFVAKIELSKLYAKILYDVLKSSQVNREFLHSNFGFERVVFELDGATTIVFNSIKTHVKDVEFDSKQCDEDEAHSDHESVAESMLSQANTKTVRSTISCDDETDPFGLYGVRFLTYADALRTIWNVLGRDIVTADEFYHFFTNYRIQIGGKNQRDLQPVFAPPEFCHSKSSRTRSERSEIEKKNHRTLCRHLSRMGAVCLNPKDNVWNRKWKYKVDQEFMSIDHQNPDNTSKLDLCSKWSKSGVFVAFPLKQDLDRIQVIVNEVNSMKKFGPMTPADFLDLESLQEIVSEAKRLLRTKASQRITVLGQTGVGKSTTLNTLLSCTMVSEDDYCRIYAQSMSQKSKFFQTRYFCNEGVDICSVSELKSIVACWTVLYLTECGVECAGIQSPEMYEDIVQQTLSADEVEQIVKAEVEQETRVLNAMRDLVGQKLDADEAEELQQMIFQSGWDFMLPAGAKSGEGGVTAHVFNIRFGPCALRVITKTKAALQKSLFLLSVMLNHSNNEQNCKTDRSWENKVKSLEAMCDQLGIYREETRECEDMQKGLHELVKQWKSHHDVPIPAFLEKKLGKVFVYVGKGEDLMVDRIYIRNMLRAWVGGAVVDDGSVSTGKDPKESLNLHFALEDFDIWLPSQLLDQYCCLSDIPGSFDGNPFTMDLMFESLRQSKSLLCFMDPARGYGQVVSDPLCDSGILKGFLDAPGEYRIILLDVVEKMRGFGPGRGLALKTLPSAQVLEREKARTVCLMDDFERCTKLAVESKRLWPHLNLLDGADSSQEDGLAAMVGRDKVSEYIDKAAVATKEVKLFSIYPITYHGLYNLKPDQAIGILCEDKKRSEAAIQQLTCADLRLLTNVPRLVNEVKSILIDGALEVKRDLTQQLARYCEQVDRLVDVAKDEGSWTGFEECVQNKQKEITKNMTKVHQLKTISSAYRYDSTGDIGPLMDALFVELKAEQSDLCDKLVSSAAASAGQNVDSRFQQFVKMLKNSRRDLVNVVTVDPEDRAVSSLLHLLYKDLLNFEVFGELWASHNRNLEQIAGKHLIVIEEFIHERYRQFLSKTDKSALFQNFVLSRSNLTMNFVKARVMKKLVDYQKVYYHRQRGGLWGMRPVLFSTSQDVLFRDLSKKDRKDAGQIEQAIRAKMVPAAARGVQDLFVFPSELLASLRFGDGTEAQGDECERLRRQCHEMFEKSIKQLASCKTAGVAWTELREIVVGVSSKLVDVRERLDAVGRDDACAKYSPTKQSKIDVDFCDVPSEPSFSFGTFEKGFGFHELWKACPPEMQRAQIYSPSTLASNEIDPASVANLDPRGLYRCLAVAIYGDDSEEVVQALCLRLGEYSIDSLVKEKVVPESSVHAQFFGRKVSRPDSPPFDDDQALNIFASMKGLQILLHDGGQEPKMFAPQHRLPNFTVHLLRNDNTFRCVIPDNEDVLTESEDEDSSSPSSKRPKYT